VIAHSHSLAASHAPLVAYRVRVLSRVLRSAVQASKVVHKDASPLSAVETRVAAELNTLAEGHPALKDALAGLYVANVREIELEGARKAVILFVPFPLLSAWRKVAKQVVDELEKKFTNAHVLIIANRTMVSGGAWARSTKTSGVRPRSRSLKAVQEALLDDIAFPSEIVGKRIRVKTDGSKLLRVYLNPKDAVALGDKVDTFRAVYTKLTNKAVSFEFPSTH